MGARPLYYTQVGQTLVFGSEIKSLLAIRGVTRAPDEDASNLVLDRWIMNPHRTCFRDIFAVPPGHALRANPDRLIVSAARISIRAVRPGIGASRCSYAEGFRDVFTHINPTTDKKPATNRGIGQRRRRFVVNAPARRSRWRVRIHRASGESP